ncbi:MAG: hypothetical protein ACREL4_08740 [Gemmatimonadales bacterium]
MAGDEWRVMGRGRAFRSGAAVGALVLTWAGGAWAVAALLNRPGAPGWTFVAVALPVLALTITAVVRLRTIARSREERSATEGAEAARRGRHAGMVFGIVFGAEIALIALAAIVLSRAGRGLLIPVAVVAIVGAHFIPLSRAFRISAYGVAGVALLALAVASFLIPDEALRDFVLGLATAAVLWASAGVVLAQET